MKYAGFQKRLLAWYDRHGRKDLPWKRARDPYVIWISEIMLQQTQVATVISYFEKFTARFPDVRSLARANLDEVLYLWTGLGYYARARHLHRAARDIMERHDGVFPRDFKAACALPGIGRSTAGAILALAHGVRLPILDGNVKRVLARYYAVAEPVAAGATQKRLWRLAALHTPRRRVADYTQAIMDLGATICRRANPECGACPIRLGCRARRQKNPHAYPVAAQRRQLPRKRVRMMLIRDVDDRVLLLRRPPVGIWGGLWGFPEATDSDLQKWSRKTLGLDITLEPKWPTIKHRFSHFDLHITPIPARVNTSRHAQRRTPQKTQVLPAMEYGEMVWYNVNAPVERGLSAPVKQLLSELRNGNGADGTVRETGSRSRRARPPDLARRSRQKNL
jgi:A/G-specific adenine glycosylase